MYIQVLKTLRSQFLVIKIAKICSWSETNMSAQKLLWSLKGTGRRFAKIFFLWIFQAIEDYEKEDYLNKELWIKEKFKVSSWVEFSIFCAFAKTDFKNSYRLSWKMLIQQQQQNCLVIQKTSGWFLFLWTKGA